MKKIGTMYELKITREKRNAIFRAIAGTVTERIFKHVMMIVNHYAFVIRLIENNLIWSTPPKRKNVQDVNLVEGRTRPGFYDRVIIMLTTLALEL